MTAISVMYTGSGFLIAADGRCRSDDESTTNKERETDQAQKIFSVETSNMKMAYAFTGFSSTEDGSFDLVAECDKQTKALALSTFSNGHQYVKRFCSNIKRVVLKARREGRMPEFSKNDKLDSEEQDRQFKFVFVGYFRAAPFWVEAGFYHDVGTGNIEIRKEDVAIAAVVHSSGSEILANMMYNPEATVDPRLARYRKDRSADGDVEYITSFIKACCDPVALELDPGCKAIGGHVHVAEITPFGGFAWRIAPLPLGTKLVREIGA